MGNNAAMQGQSAYDRSNAFTGGVGSALGGLNNWYQQNSANNGGGSGWYLGSRLGRG